jgi:hypothetical protein
VIGRNEQHTERDGKLNVLWDGPRGRKYKKKKCFIEKIIVIMDVIIYIFN